VSTDELKELLSSYVARAESLQNRSRRHPQHGARVRAGQQNRLVRHHQPLARLPHLAAYACPDGSTYVVTEETGDGANLRKLAETNPGHMHRGHDLWNISLKFLCES
jgi:hypothetical protein